MEAFVTGAAGFIGSHLTETLLDKGYTVRGFDNFSTGDRCRLRDSEVDTVEGDIRDREALFSSIQQDTDCVIHLAADTSVTRSTKEPSRTADVNCVGTSNVLEAAKRAGVGRVVVASSAAVYGSGTPPLSEDARLDSASPYGASKEWTEKIALQFDSMYGIEAVALRYFNVYGPRQDADTEYAAVIPKFIQLMLDGESPTVYGDGEQTRDFVYVEDVAEATAQAANADCSGEVYNIASGEATTVNSLVEHLNTILGEEIEPVHGQRREGEVRHSFADVSKARNELGFESQVDIREGLRETVEHMTKA